MSSQSFDLENIVVRAGAGAGKTTELTARVIGIAQKYSRQHKKFPRLVVTTFTRKATQELRERLIRKAIEAEGEQKGIGGEGTGSSQETMGLVEFIKKPHLLHISTIHGVLTLYLKLFGSRIGLSPELSFINERQNRRNQKRLIRDLAFKDESFAGHLETVLEYMGLNEFLKFSDRYAENRFTKNVAGPFTVEQMKVAIQNEIQSLIRLAQELSLRIQRSDLSESWIQLGELAKSITPGSRFSELYEQRPTVRKSKKTDEALIAVKDAFMESLKNLAAYNRTDDFLVLHQELATSFEYCGHTLSDAILSNKIASGEITMADLEFLAGYLLKMNPETAELFSQRWDYWLVDEYQDTSPLQVALIESLKGSKNEFVVGDPQQSIYLFRGARSEVFVDKENQMKSQGGSLFSKLTNYRSKPELLEFFNETFARISEAGSQQFRAMIPKADVFDSENIVAHFYLLPELPKNEDPNDWTEEVANPEYLSVLHRCQTLFKEGASPEQICVLLRSNQSILDFVEIANRWGLPVQVHSSGQFSMRPEIIEINSFLQFLLNPFHNINLVQFFRHPCFKISDHKLYEVLKTSQGHFWNSLKKSQEAPIQRILFYLNDVNERGLSEGLLSLITEFRFFEYCHQMDPSGMREANIWKYFSMLKSSEKVPGFSYKSFIENIDSSAGEDSESTEQVAVPVVAPEKVNVMTVHASKGLQFEHIIVPRAGQASRGDIGEKFLIEDSIKIHEPIQWTLSLPEPETGTFKKSLFGEKVLAEKNSRGKLEEERVLYVALTRAISSVAIIGRQDPENRSWLDLIKPIKEAGIHRTEKYSFQVFTEVPEIREFSKKALRPKELKPIDRESSQKNPMSQSGQMAKKVSVTALLERELLRESGQNYSQKSKMSDVSKAVLGVEIHRSFENLKYYYMENPQLSDQELVERLPQKFEIFADFLKSNHEGPWLEIIKNGYVEYGFTVRIGRDVLQGQIDLWGLDSHDQAWVIDYKTGSTSHVSKAFDQLRLYCQALLKMGKIKAEQPINLAVLYPFEKRAFKQKF